ncbi:unnamed protein product [Larinioides sclopetarius]|uniref:Uncharacterized protein n=1 Tax=Larinioides sclopetarius TaxID=280406 RepID=A0AAV2A2K1_9ARAC
MFFARSKTSCISSYRESSYDKVCDVLSFESYCRQRPSNSNQMKRTIIRWRIWPFKFLNLEQFHRLL